MTFKNEEDIENEANAFAINLLMPENLLRKDADKLAHKKNKTLDDRDVIKLARLYKVSIVLMAARLREFGYLWGG